MLDNNEFGYDQNEEWRTSSDGNKWRNGDYYNPKYGISSYVDIINNKGEKYREINIDEPGGGLDEKDSFSPVYRFRYKYDLKLGKYIPTNEWFMDKVIYRKQGGNLNKLPFMLKGDKITSLYNYLKDKVLEEHDLYYNDYAMQSPNKESELNISKSYFRTPTIPNVIKGTYHYLKSDPLNFYGLKQGLKLDYRRAVREDKRKYPNLSKLIYGDEQ